MGGGLRSACAPLNSGRPSGHPAWAIAVHPSPSEPTQGSGGRASPRCRRGFGGTVGFCAHPAGWGGHPSGSLRAPTPNPTLHAPAAAPRSRPGPAAAPPAPRPPPGPVAAATARGETARSAEPGGSAGHREWGGGTRRRGVGGRGTLRGHHVGTLRMETARGRCMGTGHRVGAAARGHGVAPVRGHCIRDLAQGRGTALTWECDTAWGHGAAPRVG